MEVSDHIAALRREGGRLAEVAGDADLDAPVPTCPEWRLRDLVHHLGGVHRWATTHVVEDRTRGWRDDPPLEQFVGGWPDDRALLVWFAAGHATLVEALTVADPDLPRFTFLPAPSSVAFWARRQAHETAIHRVDAESVGGSPSPFPGDFAADGIDELVLGFAVRPPAAPSRGRRAPSTFGPPMSIVAGSSTSTRMGR